MKVAPSSQEFCGCRNFRNSLQQLRQSLNQLLMRWEQKTQLFRGEQQINIRAKFAGRSEVRAVRLESSPPGKDVIRKLLNVSVVILESIVVAFALHRDAVFRAGQLILQAQEIFIRLELRVILSYG